MEYKIVLTDNDVAVLTKFIASRSAYPDVQSLLNDIVSSAIDSYEKQIKDDEVESVLAAYTKASDAVQDSIKSQLTIAETP